MVDGIQVDEAGFDEGQPAILVQTATAAYAYHKEGAGFSSLLDVDGRDWIGYAPDNGPAGEYRGIPNMVFRGSEEGAFHPGHRGAQTELLVADRDRVSLQSISRNGRWQVQWDISERCARMTVLRVDAADPRHWLLYEGTPGGQFAAQTSRCLRSSGASGTLNEAREEDLPASAWVAFTDPECRRSLFLHCQKQGGCTDMYKPMPPMTVFGFGRRLQGVDAGIEAAGTVLTIGFTETTNVLEIGAYVAEVL